MPHVFDAASKFILDAYPADWVKLAGLPVGTSARVIEADLSTVSTAADKLIAVEAPELYAAHMEFQTGPDDELDDRVLVYNVLAHRQLKMAVRSVVFALRQPAMTPAVKGRVAYGDRPDDRLDFAYRIVRVWELSVEMLLSGGIGTLPLAPISAVRDAELPGVIEAMKRRYDTEVPPPLTADLWAATDILMGLRYSSEFVASLLRGVRQMKESTTYQAILREGESKGRVDQARSDFLRAATRQFGPPRADMRTRIDALSDIHKLEELMDRVGDKTATSWEELLAD